MAKRFTSTEIWDEDWFIEMPTEYKLFWYYVLSACDHAGLFKVNLRSFCGLNEVKIDLKIALKYFNSGKQRIRVVNQTVWLIEDFFSFQYGHKFNINNPLHRGVFKQYEKFDLNLSSIRGLFVESSGLKEKEKDKEIIEGGVGETKNTNIKKYNYGNNGKPFINFRSQGEDILAKRIADRTQEIADSNRKKNNPQKDK